MACSAVEGGWALFGSVLLAPGRPRSFGDSFGDRLVEWPPKLRHGQMWKYGTVLKEGELGDEPSL